MNLIAHDLVMVHPMTSITGYISYVKYTYGSNKGGISQGDLIADPFKVASRTEDNMRYTSQAVVEEVELAEDGTATLAWHPIFKAEGKGLSTADERVPSVVGGESGVEVEVLDANAGTIKVTGATGKVKIKYAYNNVIIPQHDLPIVNAEIAGIALTAKPRRVAIYYSAIAAFQANKDYGFDLGDQLAQKAVAELNLEIDEEIVNFLVGLAEKNEDATALEEALTFNAEPRTGVSVRDHYEAFLKFIEAGKVAIYKRTQKLMPTYMLASSDILSILSLISAFKPASTAGVVGPFLAGTLNGLKVFISPSLEAGTWCLGVNGAEMESSAAVYAPYMPVMPTQLLGFADHGMSQGFATMYALEALNPLLVVKGKVVNNEVILPVSVRE